MSVGVHLRTLRCSRGPTYVWKVFLRRFLHGACAVFARKTFLENQKCARGFRASLRARRSVRPSVLPLWRCAYMHVARGRREFNVTPCPSRQSGNTMKQPFTCLARPLAPFLRLSCATPALSLMRATDVLSMFLFLRPMLRQNLRASCASGTPCMFLLVPRSWSSAEPSPEGGGFSDHHIDR